MEDETTTITVKVEQKIIDEKVMYEIIFFDKGVQYKTVLMSENDFIKFIPLEAIEAFRKAKEDNPEYCKKWNI